MKVFISWSGEESKQIALLLKGWLKKILQATDPWMSDVDIEPGTRWSQSIAGELQNSDFGIICVTPSNMSAEWINFEAGALSIAIEDGTARKVVPLLIGFDDRGALQRGPLNLFNALRFTKDDVWRLVLTLNADLPNGLDGEDLGDLFETYWPKLERQVDDLKKMDNMPSPAPMSQEDMIKEIYSSVLDLRRRQPVVAPIVAHPESITDSPNLAAKARRAALIREIEKLEAEILEAASLKPFTSREIQIATMARDGLSNTKIAELLGISPRTVEGHLYQVFSKLGIANRSDIPEDLGREDEA